MRVLGATDDKEVESEIQEMIAGTYVLDFVTSAEEAEFSASVTVYDLVIIDEKLSDASGLSLCSLLRSEDINAPILFLRRPEFDVEMPECLDLGVDYCLTKPINPREFHAKIRAALRKGIPHINRSVFYLNGVAIDFTNRLVYKDAKYVTLCRKEFEILEYLVRNINNAVSKEQLLEHVWEKGIDTPSNTVEVHMSRLRTKLSGTFDRGAIKTIYGYGYKLCDKPGSNKNYSIP